MEYKNFNESGKRWVGVVAVDGKIYAIGGLLETDRYLDTNEQYNPNTDTWSILKSMPTPRAQIAIAEYQNKIYCIGGTVGYTTLPDGSIFSLIACDLNEVYDIVTDSWSKKASLPINGSDLQAHVIDGKIFVLAGLDLFMYNPITDVWTNKTRIENAENWAYSRSSSTVNGKIIVFCKFAHISIVHPYTSYQKIFVYNPETDAWSERDCSVDVSGAAMVVTTGRYAPQKIYAIGARWLEDNTQQLFNYVYDFENDTWSTANAMSTVRNDFGVAILDDILYVIGGWTIGYPVNWSLLDISVEYTSLNEQYVPIDYSSTAYITPTPSKPYSTYLTVTTVAITTVLIVTFTIGLFLYFNKRKN